LCEVFCFKVKVTSNDQIIFQKRINPVGRFEAIASHLKNNVAKTPAETLLLNIGKGVFCLGRKEKLIMRHIHALEILNLITLEGDLRWHLQNNHYPPVPDVIIPMAVKAVILCRNDKFNETIVTFFEHQFYGWSVPAYAVVEAYHLEPWVNELEVE
jgi:hypothetical protein